MAYRSDLEALAARVEALEVENRALREELARAHAAPPREKRAPATVTRHKAAWTVESRILGYAAAHGAPFLAYTGQCDVLEDDALLRFERPTVGVLADHPLMKGSQAFATRLGHDILAQLVDGSIAAFDWPRLTASGDTAAFRSAPLGGRLAFPPIAVKDFILCATTEREVVHLERHPFRVVGRTPCRDLAEFPKLGFPKDAPGVAERVAAMSGFGFRSPPYAAHEWEGVAEVSVGKRRVRALHRSIAGREEIAACGLDGSKMVWLTQLGEGDFSAISVVDGIVVLYNIAFGALLRGGIDPATGTLIFRIEGTREATRFTFAAP